MKLKELKSKFVIAMAVPFIQEHGIQCLDDRHPRITVEVEQLDMMLWQTYTDKPHQHLDIWDRSIGKKVFSVRIAPLEITRCDPGKWFDLFMACFALQASMSIEKYLEVKKNLVDLLPAANSGRRLRAALNTSVLGNSVTE